MDKKYKKCKNEDCEVVEFIPSRSDQQFHSLKCKNEYWNRINKAIRHAIKDDVELIINNFETINALYEDGKRRVTSEMLEDLKINLGSARKMEKDNKYFYKVGCYYLLLEKDCLIIKKNKS